MDTRARAANRKTLTMERHISYVRALVVGLNVLVYVVFMRDRPRAGLAWTIVFVATLYAIWSLVGRPYERYPLLRLGMFTLIADNALILLWILGTGGPGSEFWMIYFISVVSVAMRYDLAETVGTAAAEALAYTITMLLDGGMAGPDAVLRAGYILLCGLASGLLARQERISREERVHYEELAARESAMVERLEDLSELKSTFIANAAHELRTPLTTILGAASTLSQRFDDLDRGEIRSLLDATTRQGERVRTLLDNLLDLSQLDHRTMALESRPCAVLAAVNVSLEIAPPPEGASVVVDVPADLALLADDLRLQQVLTNLLINAYHYGGPRVLVRARGDGARGIVEVSDDGGGVPASMVPALFEPFARGDNAVPRIGSGLGLSLSRRIVVALGGSLEYDGSAGSLFRITLPRATMPAGAALVRDERSILRERIRVRYASDSTPNPDGATG